MIVPTLCVGMQPGTLRVPVGYRFCRVSSNTFTLVIDS
ncbi:hypothetical protein PMI35_04340 [Pseudomonas sp. GM78]|nr:hypothetical protein PMI35_04340 [Pseudomonas sp. GM78]